jgi:hypothetical protein
MSVEEDIMVLRSDMLLFWWHERYKKLFHAITGLHGEIVVSSVPSQRSICSPLHHHMYPNSLIMGLLSREWRYLEGRMVQTSNER